MKRKVIIALASLSLALTATISCQKNVKLSDPEIELNGPANEARMDLAHIENVTFSWAKISEVSEYTLRFATSAERISSTNVRIEAGATDHYIMPSTALNSLLAAQLQAGESSDVYWSVWPKHPVEGVKMQTRKINVVALHHLLSLDGVHFESHASGPRKIVVNLDGAWTVESLEEGHWLNISPMSGNGHGAIEITPTPNTGAARTTRVTISNHHANEDIRLTVMQDAGGPIKLLSKVFLSYGGNYFVSKEFEYDSYNRLTKVINHREEDGKIISTQTINYAPLEITDVPDSGNYVKQKVFLDGEGMVCLRETEGVAQMDTLWYIPSLNSASLPDRMNFRRFTTVFLYDDIGNITEKISAFNFGFKHPSWSTDDIIHGESTSITDRARYVHDNDKAPFYACTSPKWLLRFINNNGEDLNLFNNIVSIVYEDGTISRYTHTYDNDDYVLTNTQHAEKYEYITR
ncbi:MAG: SusE domain-containing protein [Prevotellaceae bacterium]|jgi:hypothetical protein|nr:SusE domain-containing protein [Prevotellaceae bacterium]